MSILRGASLSLAVVLVAGFAACGGGGGGGDSSPPPVLSKVFAADEVNGGIGSTENSNPTPGSTLTITRIISGSNTQIPVGPGCPGCLPSLALDSARDQLYVSTNSSILVFNSAGTATGNIAPSRTISVGTNQAGRHLQLNTTTNILYVSTKTTGHIYRIDGASAASGAVTASQDLTVSPFASLTDTITDLALDTMHDVLYVGLDRNGSGKVGIILSISTKTSGTVLLDAEISAGGAVAPTITVDGPSNRLFSGGLTGQVFVFDSANTLSGAATATRTIQLPFAGQHRLFLEPTNNRLYASGQNRVVVLNNAGTATGTVTAAVAQLSTINSDLTAVVARP